MLHLFQKKYSSVQPFNLPFYLPDFLSCSNMSGKRNSSAAFLGILEDTSSLISGGKATPPFNLPKLTRSPTSILYNRNKTILSKTSPVSTNKVILDCK